MRPLARLIPQRPSRETTRRALPPAVSIGVHTLLLALIVVIGVADPLPIAQRPRLAEIATPSRAAPAETRPDTPVTPPDTTDRPTRPASRTAPTPGSLLPSPDPVERARADAPEFGLLPSTPALAWTSDLTRPEASETPTLTFAGLTAHAAERIVYVVDASGAVVPTLTYIKRNLARSVDRLAPSQRFDIIFFREPTPGADLDPRPRFAGELVSATPGTRDRAAAWVERQTAAGRSDPAAALEDAIALDPDLIFLLSTSIRRTQTGDPDDTPDLLDRLDALNPIDPRTGHRPVVIKTLQFLRPDPANLLRDVALIHGDGEGSYRLLTADQLDSPLTVEPTPDSDSPALDLAANRLQTIDTDAWTTLLALPSAAQRQAVHDAAADALSRLESVPDDARTPRWALLHQRASLFYSGASDASPSIPPLRDTLRLARTPPLTDPDADLERRLVRAIVRAILDQPSELAELCAQTGAPSVALRATLASRLYEQADAPTPDDLDHTALLLDAQNHARARLSRSPADPDAFARLLALVRDERLHPEAMLRERFVHAAISAADDTFEIDWDAMDPHAALARSTHRSLNPETRAGALQELAHLAERPDAPEPVRALALWRSAIAERDRAETDPDARERVRSRLMTLVQRFPRDPNAPAAAAAAIALGSTDDATLHPDLPTPFVSAALDTYPDHPGADRWRLGLARRARATTRLDLLDRIPPDSPETDLALDLYVETAEALSTPDALERALDYTHARAHRAWYRIALRLAETLAPPGHTGAAAHISPEDATRSADLYLALARRPERIGSPGEHELGFRAGQALARACASDPSLAPRAVRVLTELADETEGDRPPLFWHAWAVALETIAAHAPPRDPARDDARAHLARLRLLDAELGRDPWQTRLRRAAESLDSPT